MSIANRQPAAQERLALYGVGRTVRGAANRIQSANAASGSTETCTAVTGISVDSSTVADQPSAVSVRRHATSRCSSELSLYRRQLNVTSRPSEPLIRQLVAIDNRRHSGRPDRRLVQVHVPTGRTGQRDHPACPRDPRTAESPAVHSRTRCSALGSAHPEHPGRPLAERVVGVRVREIGPDRDPDGEVTPVDLQRQPCPRRRRPAGSATAPARRTAGRARAARARRPSARPRSTGTGPSAVRSENAAVLPRPGLDPAQLVDPRTGRPAGTPGALTAELALPLAAAPTASAPRNAPARPCTHRAAPCPAAPRTRRAPCPRAGPSRRTDVPPAGTSSCRRAECDPRVDDATVSRWRISAVPLTDNLPSTPTHLAHARREGQVLHRGAGRAPEVQRDSPTPG